MTHWTARVIAVWLASLPSLASARVDCDAVPEGPARTDCYIALGRIYRGQSDIGGGTARVQSHAARYRLRTGTDRPGHKRLGDDKGRTAR